MSEPRAQLISFQHKDGTITMEWMVPILDDQGNWIAWKFPVHGPRYHDGEGCCYLCRSKISRTIEHYSTDAGRNVDVCATGCAS